jgi:hexokinase
MTFKQQILARVEQAFRVTDDQLNDLVLGFNEEMKAGLDNTNRATKGSELKMIPSYVTGKNKNNKKENQPFANDRGKLTSR